MINNHVKPTEFSVYEEQGPGASVMYVKESHGNCRCEEALSESPAVTCVCPPAGTAVTCSVPAAATRRSQCQASSCSSPPASARPATAASSSARLPWTWSWRNPSQPAPTEFQRTGTGGESGRAASRRHGRTAEERAQELHRMSPCT